MLCFVNYIQQQFIKESGIINNTTYLVADGVASSNCSSNRIYGPSYNMGVTIGKQFNNITTQGNPHKRKDVRYLNKHTSFKGALVETSHVFHSERDKFISVAHKIAEATIKNMTK